MDLKNQKLKSIFFTTFINKIGYWCWSWIYPYVVVVTLLFRVVLWQRIFASQTKFVFPTLFVLLLFFILHSLLAWISFSVLVPFLYSLILHHNKKNNFFSWVFLNWTELFLFSCNSSKYFSFSHIVFFFLVIKYISPFFVTLLFLFCKSLVLFCIDVSTVFSSL